MKELPVEPFLFVHGRHTVSVFFSFAVPTLDAVVLSVWMFITRIGIGRTGTRTGTVRWTVGRHTRVRTQIDTVSHGGQIGLVDLTKMASNYWKFPVEQIKSNPDLPLKPCTISGRISDVHEQFCAKRLENWCVNRSSVWWRQSYPDSKRRATSHPARTPFLLVSAMSPAEKPKSNPC